MKNAGKIKFFLMFLTLLFVIPVRADPVSVTTRINNVPPTLPYIDLEGNGEIIFVYGVKESNSFWDIESVKITILSDEKETLLSWKPGMNDYEKSGTYLRIGEAVLPEGEMKKIGTFDFSFKIYLSGYSHIDVFVEVTDRAGQKATGYVFRGG